MARLFLLSLLLACMISPLKAKTILIMGDSLSAAYGIDEKQSWVALLDKCLAKHSLDYQIVNLSISGYTTSNGVSRLPSGLTKYKPDIVIIELGANDGLRGLSIQEIKANLEKMIIQSQKKKTKILLLATWLPPNYGPNYLTKFNQIYVDLAAKYKLPLVPMFLEGVGGDHAMMLSDGLHPNQEAQEKILQNVWPALKPLL